jgi:hypothetical protein
MRLEDALCVVKSALSELKILQEQFNERWILLADSQLKGLSGEI